MAVEHFTPPRSAVARRAGPRPLLELDPDLGARLTPERLLLAKAQLRAGVVRLSRGVWHSEDLAAIDGQNVGLLVIDGVIAREVGLEDTVSTELLGPGDLLRPWCGANDTDPLQPGIRWQVLADVGLAVLGSAFGVALSRFPEVNAVLIDRVCGRAERLATMRAIGHLNSVDRRLLALFWHLAGQWGRVTPDGVVVPLTLSHRLLGELVGARRPTVSTALATLERTGRLRRRPDATWLLTGEAPVNATPALPRVIPHRRRLLHSASDRVTGPVA